MKTPNTQDRATNLIATASKTRARRTAARFACESLEGRKLMTGFAGAGPMVDHSFAEMGGMNGGGDFARHDDSDRMDAPAGGTIQANAATTTGTGATGTTDDGPSGWNRSFAQDGRTDRADDFGGMGGGRIGADDDFAGGGRTDDQGFGDRMDDRGFGDRMDAAAAPMSGTTGSTQSTQLQTDFTKLQTDKQAIHDKSQVTPALEAAVRKDMEAIDAAKTGTASATALQTLKTDEQAIFGGSTSTTSTTTTTSTSTTTPATPMAPPTLTDAQKTTLQNDHNAILLSQGVSQTLINQLATDRLAVTTASNFTPADQATLDADHKAIETDLAALHSGDSTTTGSTTATTTTATATPTTTATSDVAVASTAATPATAAATDPAATTTTTTGMPEMHHFGMDDRGGFAHEASTSGRFGVNAMDQTAGDSIAHDDSFGGDRGGFAGGMGRGGDRGFGA